LDASQRLRKARRKRFAYDVFLSYNAKDKPAVRELAERLKQDGLRVWFDEWVIQPGDLVSLKIEQGLEQSRTLILAMSHNAFASEWVALERHTALFRDPTNAERRFIPLRLDDAEITDTLKQFAYIDWRQKAPYQYAKLLTACRPASAETRPARKRHRRSPAVTVLKGHMDIVRGVAITPDGWRAISGSDDATVRVWDLETGQCLATLEADTSYVLGVAVTPDGRRAISSSADKTVRVWNLPPIAGEVRQAGEATRYTNAKVLLVGDSGVGKSGLAYRLTEDQFVATISTDAAWATQLPLPHDTGGDDIKREIWLWDFAGQADYRLVHQLYMDETALAVLVFNPQSENPFEGLGQWDHDLMRAARRPFQKLLVAGRCDRGGLMVSRESIERFRGERGFAVYLETSAYTGAGCQELRETIVHSIPWTDIAWTSSPRIFKVLKDAIVKPKDEGKVLLRIEQS
jgi:small GTP-binding protein